MKTDENNSRDWLLLAKERLEKADALFNQFGASYSGVELLQESVERYLKGYLVGKGWKLERIRDLNRLLEAAMSFDPQFAQFAELAHSLTEQFWEQHYPGGDLSEVGADYPELRQQAGELVALIYASIPPSGEPKQP